MKKIGYLPLSFLLLSLAASPLACDKKKSGGPNGATPNRPARIPDQKEKKQAAKQGGWGKGREGKIVVRSLIREAPRAEMFSNGNFINLGSPDQSKYIPPSKSSSWSTPKTEKATSYLEAEREATLVLHDWRGGIRTVVARVRAPQAGVELKVAFNNQVLETVPIKTTWDLVEISLEQPTSPGRVKLRFLPTNSKGKPGLIHIDWIWLRHKGEFPPAPAKVWTMKLDAPRRSLRADPPRSYSYYLEVPKKVSLSFGYGATVETRFAITLHRDGAEPVTLFNHQHSGKKWMEEEVNLSEYAGQMVRLEFATSSKGKEREVEAAWAEPDLIGEGKLTALAPVPKEKQAKNVIYIVLDAARQDVFKPFDASAAFPTPSVSALAMGGTTFTNAYTPANWTLPSVVGLFTGRYPHSFGHMGEMFKLPRQVPVLAEHLKKQGFETAALVGNPFVSKPFGLKRGWDTFHNYSEEGRPTTIAEFLYRQAGKWLDGRKDKDKRFFLYLHAMDTHDPYMLHPNTASFYEGEYRGQLKDYKLLNTDINIKKSKHYRKLTDEDRRWIRALYHGEVAFHDAHLKMLLGKLTALGLSKNTLVIFSSDHGEELWDHGGLDHGTAMYEEQIKTPLAMRFEPVFKPGSRVDELVELLDVTPTMLEVLGVPALPGTHGVSLRHLLSPGRKTQAAPYAIMSGNRLTVIVGQYKLFGGLAKGKLFDLKEDPTEKKNLIKTHHIARRACEVYLGEGFSVPNKRERLTSAGSDRKHKAEKVVLDDKLRKQLEALGYME